MRDVRVTYVGVQQFAQTVGNSPCFIADVGDELVGRIWVTLTEHARFRLERELGLEGEELLEEAGARLRFHGTRKIEQMIRDLPFGPGPSAPFQEVIVIDSDSVRELIDPYDTKPCAYRMSEGRDHYCLTPSRADPGVRYSLSGRPASVTSMPLCRSCELPSTEILCSSFSHPEVTSVEVMSGIIDKRVVGALCNDGQEAINDVDGCCPGGHGCWKRSVAWGLQEAAPRAQPEDLPDALDTLNAYWRLAFGKHRQLIAVNSLSAVSELSLASTSREEFKSRISALADLIDKLKIDDDLIPESVTGDARNGSLNRLESALGAKLGPDRQDDLRAAIGILRQSRRVRIALQHTGGGKSLAAELAVIGIHDVHPNWTTAFDVIRSISADAVNDIRRMILEWQESGE